jgi:SAM-dependent methyltransferase
VNAEISKAVLQLNRRFYRQFAPQFSATRQRPWPGWERVLARHAGNRERLSILDLGCGNGRFAVACDQFLQRPWSYVGVDDSPWLLAAACARLFELGTADGQVTAADLLASEDFLPAGPFDLVVLFGVMHHVPGAEARRALLARALRRVSAGGCLAVSYWQFGDSARLMARTVAPAAVGLPAGEFGPADHLLRWGAGEAVRYCHHCDPTAASRLAADVGATVVESFRADGEDGGLNLYHLLVPGQVPAAEAGRTDGE